MANLFSGSALDALNEQDYINKLYGNNSETEKKLIEDNYTDNTNLLNSEQTRVQQQTQENVDRTQVESQTAQEKYSGPNLTLGAGQQETLARENAVQGNVVSLQQRESELDAEIERQRQLLKSQYETAIKQAQAENDMEKAQQLYNAAKAEEEKMMQLRQQAMEYLVGKDEASVYGMVMGGLPKAEFKGETWEQVLENEDTLNDIYNKQLEAKSLGIQSDYEQSISDLLAKQDKQQANTDKNLTQTYVDALQKMKNYAEVQSAYGQGSGTAGAARIAQDIGLQKALTALRLGQMDSDAGFGADRFEMGKDYGKKMYSAVSDTNRQRAEALLEAANREEEMLFDEQLALGLQLASEGDYTMIGMLYGMSPAEIKKLKGSGGSGGSSSGGSSSNTTRDQQIAKEVEAATVIDSLGRPAENSAYWNSQKTSAYYK